MSQMHQIRFPASVCPSVRPSVRPSLRWRLILQPLAHTTDKRRTRDQEVAGSSITHFAVGVPPWQAAHAKMA